MERVSKRQAGALAKAGYERPQLTEIATVRWPARHCSTAKTVNAMLFAQEGTHMRVRLWCVLLCSLLAVGCAESQVQTAAEQEAGDDIKCHSGGAKPGDAAYLECRAQTKSARTQSGIIPHPGAAMSGGR